MAPSPLTDLVRPVRTQLIVAVTVQAIGAIAGVVPFIAVAELGRTLLSPPIDVARVTVIVGVAIVALLLRVVCLAVAAAVTHFADADLGLALRRRMVDRLGRVPLGWFTARNSAEVRKALNDDVSAMHHLVGHTYTAITAAVVIPAVSIGYLVWVDWRVALLTIVPLVLGVGIYGWIMSISKDGYVEFDRASAQVMASSVEFAQGIAVVKTFGQTGRAHRRFTDAADAYADYFLSWIRRMLPGSAAMDLLLSPLFSLLWVLAIGAVFIVNGWLTPVDLLPFALLGVGLTAPVLALGYSANDIRTARQAADRVGGVLATPTLTRPLHPQRPADITVRFGDVGFSYDGDVAAVSDVTFELAPGTVTALVGASGSGKTTIARLLPRFFDPDTGMVSIGGVDLRRLDDSELYSLVSFVFQDVHLQRATVADNIALARPDADRAEIESAARAAQIHDRILGLPRGYDSVVGQDAVLSGGEVQRISIARCLLADAPILVLDEATAFADPESEAAIQDALSTLAAGRTLLVIAHRLSTIEGADQILVLEQGHVVERGRHDELIARGGVYARMHDADQRASTRARGIGAEAAR